MAFAYVLLLFLLHSVDYAVGRQTLRGSRGDIVDACGLGRLEWALAVDGRDAADGPRAYSASSFDDAIATMRTVLAEDNSEDLTMDIASDIREDCCSADKSWGYRTPKYGAPLCRQGFGGPLGICMSLVSDCELKRSIVADLPKSIIRLVYKKSELSRRSSCIQKDVKAHVSSLSRLSDVVGIETEEIKNSTTRPCPEACIDKILTVASLDASKEFSDMLSVYNADLKLALLHKGNNTQVFQQQQLHALAKFMRAMAWLHPFTDANGRFRNLLMQREIKRLGLGCGAMMYNNNRDIYFTNTSTYARKIEEAISVANDAREAERASDRNKPAVNPWLDPVRVARHGTRFPPPGNVDDSACVAAIREKRLNVEIKRQWGSIELQQLAQYRPERAEAWGSIE